MAHAHVQCLAKLGVWQIEMAKSSPVHCKDTNELDWTSVCYPISILNAPVFIVPVMSCYHIFLAESYLCLGNEKIIIQSRPLAHQHPGPPETTREVWPGTNNYGTSRDGGGQRLVLDSLCKLTTVYISWNVHLWVQLITAVYMHWILFDNQCSMHNL